MLNHGLELRKLFLKPSVLPPFGRAALSLPGLSRKKVRTSRGPCPGQETGSESTGELNELSYVCSTLIPCLAVAVDNQASSPSVDV